MVKKSISIIALSVAYFHGFAQVTSHLDPQSLVFVAKDALYYNSGGVQIKDGLFKNTGRVMMAGDASSVLKTIKADNSPVSQTDTQQNVGGRFLNVLNEPSNYPLPNTQAQGNNYTYGQLYISGFDQSNITGYVQQEFRNVNHGAYEQVAIPFHGKALNSLSSEFGKTFTPVRWSQNEILRWANDRVVFDNLDFSLPVTSPTGYYILGNKANSLNVSSVTRTVTGVPYTDGSNMVQTLFNAGGNVNFGSNGTAINQYNERYNSYLQDGFELQSAIGGVAWQGNYGKNLYQFANPFLMNIDLRNIFVNETNGDGNYISNIYGIRVEQAEGTVSYTPGQGGGANSFRYVTWDNATSSPVGDVDWLIVRPMSVFVIKLKDNATSQSLDFNTLRRFAYTPRLSTTPYSPTSTRTVKEAQKSTPNTVKQLGVIALDTNNKEIGRMYYVVSPTAVTGHSSQGSYQVASSSTNVVGSYEELPNSGDYDNNYTSKYWLYINEANENDFHGKAIPGVIYDSRVKSLKFELRENSLLSDEGTSVLSAGIPFYYKIDGNLQQVTQNQTVNVNVPSELEFKLYYGKPATLTTDAGSAVKSRTFITYNPSIGKYIVRFDPKWKKADVQVFDMAGRLVIDAKTVQTDSDYVINLWNVNSTYFVHATNKDTGEVVSGKIVDNIHTPNNFIK